jgi:hypothetical protein
MRLPDRPLLVIDLNGVLLDRRGRELAGRPALGAWGKRYAYERPHAAEFVAWASESMSWRVGLWTSALRENAGPMARAVLGDAYGCVSFLYTQEECEVTDLGKKGKPLFRKPLARLWREGLGLPRSTVLLDDGWEKICPGEEDNTLICPRYNAASGQEDVALGPGGRVRAALTEIMAAEDVRSVIVQTY